MTKTLCGAKTRAGGECKQPAMPNGRCRFHGGLSPRGVAHPNFRHGRYSKYMPKDMLPTYEAGLQDPELLALVDEIALVDARVVNLLEKLHSKESGRAWLRLSSLWRDFDLAMRRGDADEIQYLRIEIDRVIRQGVGETAQWDELGKQIDRLSRLKREERDRRVSIRQLVQADQVIAALIAVVESTTTAVRKHTDVPTARAILEEVTQAYELVAGQRVNP